MPALDKGHPRVGSVRIPRNQYRPRQFRCGICDGSIGDDDATTFVDDERCHADCAAAGGIADSHLDLDLCCDGCGDLLNELFRRPGSWYCESCAHDYDECQAA